MFTVEGVSVRLQRNTEDLRKYSIVVQAYSLKRPGLKSTTEIDPGKAKNKHTLLQTISAGGAACAEYLGNKYGDNIDPEKAAHSALKAFSEEVRRIVELSKDLPAKVKRLEDVGFKLKNNERELLYLIRWNLDKKQQIVSGEINWIDKMINRLHSGEL